MADHEATPSQIKWPYSKPKIKPKKTSEVKSSQPKNYYVKGPVDAYCTCDGHVYDPLLNKYKKLEEKEKLLDEELKQLNAEMADEGNQVLDHECDTYDDKMERFYKIDYIKRGWEPLQYTQLLPHVDSSIGSPTKQVKTGLGYGYREPDRFRYSPVQRPGIDPCPPVTLAQMPSGVETWFTPQTGRTEYQDTFSKVGLSTLKSQKQYVEPLPSSRRRYGEMQL